MTLSKIAKEIKDFSAVRKWANDDPNELIVALNIELAELGEHFIWKKQFAENYSETEKKELAYEMVDVLIYLLQFANMCGIEDLGLFYKEKIKKLAKKYPIDMNKEDWHKNHKAYKDSGMNKLYE